MKITLIIITLLIFTSLGYAGIIHIPAEVSTIQGGIELAAEGDTVLVAENTYFENINFKGKAITVTSQFIMDGDTSHISRTIIDGSQASDPDSGSVVCMVSSEDTNSVLCGFTITGGTGTNSDYEGAFKAGGGVYIFLSGGRVINNKLVYNTIDAPEMYCYGAGIAAFGSSIIIRENHISNNTINSYWGGGAGASIDAIETLWFERNIVSKNQYIAQEFGSGGGICILGNDFPGILLINQNIIENNEAQGSSVHGNGYGGGIYLQGQSPNLTNNLITGNKSGKGGGLYINSSRGIDSTARPVLINNTIAKNAANEGGGLYNTYSYPKVINTIIAYNTTTSGLQYNEIMGKGASSLIILRNSLVMGGWNADSQDVLSDDPRFVDVEDSDFHLTQFSPCVGRGTKSIEIDGVTYTTPSEDCDGNSRPNAIDDSVDIGAFESNFPFTSIMDIKTGIPKKYVLGDNYPNPFNPTTTIHYQLPISTYVDLSIFNLLGQKVVTLISENKKPGVHQVEWNAQNFASGIYYYRLKAGDFVDTKKLVLLR